MQNNAIQQTMFPEFMIMETKPSAPQQLHIVLHKQIHDPENGQFSSPLKIALNKIDRLLIQIKAMTVNYRIWADKKEKRIAELEKRLSKYEVV